jgi:predicted small secreted protein
MSRRTRVIALAAWLLVLAGCNTMQGFGRDIEAIGEAIQRKTTR